VIPLDLNAEAQPPHGEFAEAVDRVGRREGHAVVGPNHLREPKVFEGALKDREGEFLLCRQQCLAGE
jgi:hypothetical protein